MLQCDDSNNVQGTLKSVLPPKAWDSKGEGQSDMVRTATHTDEL